jgi:hypothetical protein
VWGRTGAGPLLDWLGVPPNRRFTRESALDGDDEAGLRGLVLLDLPDFDSIEARTGWRSTGCCGLVDLVCGCSTRRSTPTASCTSSTSRSSSGTAT